MGHSLGGITLASWAEKYPEKVKAMVLMGSFLERKRFTIEKNGKYSVNIKLPTLTIAGELDGLARVFRMAEAYHR